jgi:hypothetical protein
MSGQPGSGGRARPGARSDGRTRIVTVTHRHADTSADLGWARSDCLAHDLCIFALAVAAHFWDGCLRAACPSLPAGLVRKIRLPRENCGRWQSIKGTCHLELSLTWAHGGQRQPRSVQRWQTGSSKRTLGDPARADSCCFDQPSDLGQFFHDSAEHCLCPLEQLDSWMARSARYLA